MPSWANSPTNPRGRRRALGDFDHLHVNVIYADAPAEPSPAGAVLGVGNEPGWVFKAHGSKQIDRWVVNAALSAISGGEIKLAGERSCAINLSGQTIADDAFLGFVVDALDRLVGGDPHGVEGIGEVDAGDHEAADPGGFDGGDAHPFGGERRGIVGAEALIRWQHPTRGFVSP